MHVTGPLIARLLLVDFPRQRHGPWQLLDFDVGHSEYGSAALTGFAHRGAGYDHRLFAKSAARFVQNAAHHDVRLGDVRFAGWLLHRFTGDM